MHKIYWYAMQYVYFSFQSSEVFLQFVSCGRGLIKFVETNLYCWCPIVMMCCTHTPEIIEYTDTCVINLYFDENLSHLYLSILFGCCSYFLHKQRNCDHELCSRIFHLTKDIIWYKQNICTYCRWWRYNVPYYSISMGKRYGLPFSVSTIMCQKRSRGGGY